MLSLVLHEYNTILSFNALTLESHIGISLLYHSYFNSSNAFLKTYIGILILTYGITDSLFRGHKIYVLNSLTKLFRGYIKKFPTDNHYFHQLDYFIPVSIFTYLFFTKEKKNCYHVIIPVTENIISFHKFSYSYV